METWRRGILAPKGSGTSCTGAVKGSIGWRASADQARGTIAWFPEGALREVEEPVGKLQKWIRVEVNPSDEWEGGWWGGGGLGFLCLIISRSLSLYVRLSPGYQVPHAPRD